MSKLELGKSKVTIEECVILTRDLKALKVHPNPTYKYKVVGNYFINFDKSIRHRLAYWLLGI